MKVKYQQLYSNDCGIAAVKNLLNLYQINFNINIDINEQGTSLLSIKNKLEEYFYDVKVVSFDINQIKNVKKFMPFIALITNKKQSHYVVIYKKDHKYLYILDSLAKYSYKLTYKDYSLIDAKKYIVAESIKQETFKIKNNKYLFIIPFLSLIESIFLLSTTILIQQIIDNGINNAIIYIIVQLLLLLITTYRVRLFLKMFKNIDNTLIKSTLKGLYNLQDSYYDRYDNNEIYFRLYDAYSYKSMLLSIVFDFINDIILALCALSLMFVYSLNMATILCIILVPIILISLKVFKKIRLVIEKKRIAEYEFSCFYRDNYKTLKKQNDKAKKQFEIQSCEKLIEYQKYDYSIERIANYKNLFLLYFQSLIISLIVLLYFTSLNSFLSIGSLVAFINLVSLVLQPVLNICSNITNYSNMNLHKKRIQDIQDHIK